MNYFYDTQYDMKVMRRLENRRSLNTLDIHIYVQFFCLDYLSRGKIEGYRRELRPSSSTVR
jgi:hypothetical protein